MSNSGCPGISDPVNAAYVAIDAIFLLGGCVLFLVWFIGRLAQIRTKSILKWYLYGFALIFYCLSLALNLAFTLVNACDIGLTSAITKGYVAVEWFWQFAHWGILATVMLMVCGALFRAVNGTGKIVYFISTPILLLVAILMLAYLCLYAVQINQYDAIYGYYYNTNTRGQLVTAEDVFNLIGVIVAIILIVVGMAQMSSRNIRLGSLAGWLPILMVCYLGSACVRLAETVIDFDTLTYTTAGLIAIWALENLFILMVMIALIGISINSTIKDAINPPRPTQNQPAALAPGGPQMVQGVYNPNVPRYSAAVPGQPGMQPVYAYQMQPGQQQPQQYYQQQPVFVQQQPVQQFHPQPVPPQQMNQQFVQSVSPSREIDQMATEHSTQNKEVPQVVSPVTEKPVELPEVTNQQELP